MSWRTVVVSSRCKLSYKNNYLIVRNDEVQMIHLSEINTLVIETTLVSITGVLLCELLNKKLTSSPPQSSEGSRIVYPPRFFSISFPHLYFSIKATLDWQLTLRPLSEYFFSLAYAWPEQFLGSRKTKAL